jgi:uncharacterized protein (TIGR03435 family)
MRRWKRRIAVAAFVLAATPFAFAQNAVPEQAAKLPEFEVVSLKPSDPQARYLVGVQLTKGELTMNLTTLRELICVAYNVPSWEIAGGEPWMAPDFGNRQNHFDLVAKLPQDLAPFDLRHANNEVGDERIRQMMQAMLADRFKLRFHRETTPGKVSILEPSGKPILLVSTTLKYAKRYGEGYSELGGAVEGKGLGFYNITMPQLAKFLSTILRHPVIDKTGLHDNYDFQSATIVTKDDFQNGDIQSMFLPAVKEMGLRLTESTGPVETFVIDHAEPPTAN